MKYIYVNFYLNESESIMDHLDPSEYKLVTLQDIKKGNIKNLYFVYDHKRDVWDYLSKIKIYKPDKLRRKNEIFSHKNLLSDYIRKKSNKLYKKYFLKQLSIQYPKGIERLNQLDQSKHYIVKPVNSSRGRGIRLFKGTSGIKEYIDERKERYLSSGKPKWVVQRYLDDPLLLDGRKFHLRVLMLLYDKKTFHASKVIDYSCFGKIYNGRSKKRNT